MQLLDRDRSTLADVFHCLHIFALSLYFILNMFLYDRGVFLMKEVDGDAEVEVLIWNLDSRAK